MTQQLQVDARRQRLLFDRFVCPRCKERVDVNDKVSVDDVVIRADIVCAAHAVVGVVRHGVPSFLDRDVLDADDRLRVPLGDALEPAHLRGAWHSVDQGALAEGISSTASGSLNGTGVVFDVLAHAWSGVCRFSLGEHAREVDLCAADAGPRQIVIDGLPLGRHEWTAGVVRAGNAGMHATQLVLRGVLAITEPTELDVVSPLPVNRGNPYPPELAELLREAPPDAFVLDLGGGDRRHPDPRVFNLEYLPYRAVDLYADGLSLPFADGCIDLILSQAVLEHVPDPRLAVDEIRRVLRPGGLVHAEFAFIQPLHAVPFHFFNITTHGAALLFEAFDDVQIHTFGGLGVTLEWMFSLIGADDKVGPDATAQVLEIVRRVDDQLTSDQLDHVASAVAVLARAPVERNRLESHP